ncbi:hypothetical protein [Corynebacterium suedekumii]|uniref:Uncharacterized protein n=1 Tax=Corynebacterium suedekumii TaxID=3049801 RepID=A0ABY8VLX9_9CORY|nr:hypothetical protein [Corynebacterium suedekumii]WIM70646.1 hypothetical protein QP029_02065 [Corynebacterium suedekumii]
MKLPPVRRRRHGKLEELTVPDLDPYLTVPDDALVGSATDAEVIFIGPVGVGKTTAVETLSSVVPVNTEVVAAAPDEFTSPWKKTTTVGIDYGMWEHPDGSVVGLFGTAGQERFDDSRAPLNNPDAGVVLWFYGQPDLLEEQLDDWLGPAGGRDQAHRMCIALNFVEEGAVEEMDRILAARDLSAIPVIVANPREHDDVARVVSQAIGFLKELHS